MKIGAKIKLIRESKRLSQTDLSDGANCTQAAISMYETNKRTPTLKHFVSICKTLDIPYWVLLEGVEFIDEEE